MITENDIDNYENCLEKNTTSTANKNDNKKKEHTSFSVRPSLVVEALIASIGIFDLSGKHQQQRKKRHTNKKHR